LANTKTDGARPNAATLQSMHRGMLFLELLSERPMRAKELADATDTKWTTAHRTLAYLRDHDYVWRDTQSGLHYVGRRMFSIGMSYLDEHAIVNAGRPLLRSVADETGGFLQIVERDGFSSTAVAHVEPRTPIPALAFNMLGRRFPLHTGARGQVLLAYSPPEFLDEYLSRPLAALTPHSITDPEELREKLDRVRSQSYALTSQDVTMVSQSIAAPIRNADSEVIASAALIDYYEEGRDFSQEAVRAVVELARSLSHYAGWRVH
jgi:DNA-binding IclR family transcriptional regulator